MTALAYDVSLETLAGKPTSLAPHALNA